MFYSQIALAVLSLFSVLIFGPRLAASFSKLSLSSPASVITVTLSISLIISGMLASILSVLSSALNSFQFFSFSKMIILPTVYLLVFIALTWMSKQKVAVFRTLPLWWWVMLGILFVSTFLAIWIPRQLILLSPALQGLALILGLLVFVVTGAAAHKWSTAEKYALLFVVIGAGVFVRISGVDLGPFSPMVFPAGVIALWLGVRLREHRLLLLTFGILLLLPGLSTDLSLANISQLAVGLGLIVLFMIRRKYRKVLLATGIIVVFIGASVSGLSKLLFGDSNGVLDVTLSHRAFETMAVWEQNLNSPFSFLFGLGPSATIDLSQSPDVNTLLWSGRDIFRVDDVHFISSWIVLKFGVVGLMVLLLLFIWLGKELFAFISASDQIDYFIGSIWIIVLSGLAFGSPAATYIFTYPLIGIGLGILIWNKSVSNSKVQNLQGKNQSWKRTPKNIGTQYLEIKLQGGA